MVGAGHHDHAFDLEGHHGDDAARARAGAGPAAGALPVVHRGQTVNDVDGVEGAGGLAVAHAETSVGAALDAADQVGRAAGGLTGVLRAAQAVAVVSAAVDHGPVRPRLLHFHAQDGRDGLGARLASHGALVDGCALLDEALGVLATAHEAAAAAVGAGQHLQHRLDAGVHLHRKGHVGPAQHEGHQDRQQQHGPAGQKHDQERHGSTLAGPPGSSAVRPARSGDRSGLAGAVAPWAPAAPPCSRTPSRAAAS